MNNNKKFLKFLGVDAALVLLNIGVLNIFIKGGFTLSEIILAAICGGGSLAVHFGAPIIDANKEAKKIAEANKAILNFADNQFEEYMGKLRSLQKSAPSFSGVINRFAEQVAAFHAKEDSLEALIELNDGTSEAFLISRNDEVQKCLFRNLKKLLKFLIAYRAKSSANRAATVEHDPGVMRVLANNDKLLTLYDKLLEEVAMMGEGFNINDPGLQHVIESLQELRGGEEDDDLDDADGIKLEI